MSSVSTSLQEAAAAFANDVLGMVNQAVLETVGIDVLWFRLIPDKRNQDIIFQSYTLYGVDDCPLNIRAVYSDSGYDDAAITYNIMGLEYAVPLTLDIPVNTWYAATNYDGTQPQRGDIVFIPQSSKLVEVVSMTPVKAVGAQITSYKVNCSVYKPKRSVIVGENLRTSIENNTVNQTSLFGTEIDNQISDIVDSKQSSMFTGTSQDEHKEVKTSSGEDTIFVDQRTSESYNLMVDGHLVARSYYNMDTVSGTVVRYKNSADSITKDCTRCLSAWVKMTGTSSKRNIKKITPVVSGESAKLQLAGQLGLGVGDDVIIERSSIMLRGTVTSLKPCTVEIDYETYSKLAAMSDKWYMMPGFTARKSDPVNLITGAGDKAFSIDIVGGSFVCVGVGENVVQVPLTSVMQNDLWYGVIVNVGEKVRVDIFEQTPLNKFISISGIRNRFWNDNEISSYYITSSKSKITNIRLYTVENTDIDKQIEDLISYNIKNNSLAIVNDSADIHLTKPYVGMQR